ncbi:MAG TPA: uracil-DNA glycosylase family protein [Bacteroidales bacterium]|nr:uracil-DNA glycosylase family protein [Bacteroidales bacterium]
MYIEFHPLEPFLPPEAKILMLGSFPPPRNKWSMEFFYPNFQNDMWRIFGIVFHEEKEYFITNKKFDAVKIKDFCYKNGIAIYDTATAVKRLRGNASDNYLEIVDMLNLKELLLKIPKCNTIAATGKKALDIILKTANCKEPEIGNFSFFQLENRQIKLYRLPSSSRAYPMPLNIKAAYYQRLFSSINML